MAKKNKSFPLSDGVPYKDLYAAIAGLYGSPAAGEAGPLCWDRTELVRFFKRIGSVPADYSRRKASLRVLLASQEMARSSGVPVADVYQHLCLFAASQERGLCLERPECPRCPLSHLCKHAVRTITIKDLPPGERPSERLLAKGAGNVRDSELLAVIIGGGSSRENAIDLARRLVATFGSLQRLERAGNRELEAIPGIGKMKAARLKAAFELGRRCRAAPLGKRVSIKGSKQVFQHYRHKLSNVKKEMFLSVLLDTRHRVICEDEVSVGSLNESIVHPREAFKRAVSESAHAVLFVHNHPSGDPGPSPQDHRLTGRLVEAGKLIGIDVVDHLIVGKDSYYSFAEHGGI